LCLETGEAVSDVLKAFADGLEMVQPFLEAEIDEVVGYELVAQKGRELFVLLEEGVFEVGAEGVMAMLDAIDDGGELAAHLAVRARAEDLGDLVGGEAPQPELAAAPRVTARGLWIGKLRLKMKLRQYSIWAIA
jgi:hypothetical protein